MVKLSSGVYVQKSKTKASYYYDAEKRLGGSFTHLKTSNAVEWYEGDEKVVKDYFTFSLPLEFVKGG